jgi:hypothetical protein
MSFRVKSGPTTAQYVRYANTRKASGSRAGTEKNGLGPGYIVRWRAKHKCKSRQLDYENDLPNTGCSDESPVIRGGGGGATIRGFIKPTD